MVKANTRNGGEEFWWNYIISVFKAIGVFFYNNNVPLTLQLG